MGIIGMTHDHVWQILNHPKHEGMELVGFAEPNKELALNYLKKANLPESLWFSSLEEMVEKAKPEAVCDFRSTIEHLETVQKCCTFENSRDGRKTVGSESESSKGNGSFSQKT